MLLAAVALPDSEREERYAGDIRSESFDNVVRNRHPFGAGNNKVATVSIWLPHFESMALVFNDHMNVAAREKTADLFNCNARTPAKEAGHVPRTKKVVVKDEAKFHDVLNSHGS